MRFQLFLLFLIGLCRASTDGQQKALDAIAKQISRDNNIQCVAPSVTEQGYTSWNCGFDKVKTSYSYDWNVTELFVPRYGLCVVNFCYSEYCAEESSI